MAAGLVENPGKRLCYEGPEILKNAIKQPFDWNLVNEVFDRVFKAPPDDLTGSPWALFQVARDDFEKLLNRPLQDRKSPVTPEQRPGVDKWCEALRYRFLEKWDNAFLKANEQIDKTVQIIRTEAENRFIPSKFNVARSKRDDFLFQAMKLIQPGWEGCSVSPLAFAQRKKELWAMVPEETQRRYAVVRCVVEKSWEMATELQKGYYIWYHAHAASHEVIPLLLKILVEKSTQKPTSQFFFRNPYSPMNLAAIELLRERDVGLIDHDPSLREDLLSVSSDLTNSGKGESALYFLIGNRSVNTVNDRGALSKILAQIIQSFSSEPNNPQIETIAKEIEGLAREFCERVAIGVLQMICLPRQAPGHDRADNLFMLTEPFGVPVEGRCKAPAVDVLNSVHDQIYCSEDGARSLKAGQLRLTEFNQGRLFVKNLTQENGVRVHTLGNFSTKDLEELERGIRALLDGMRVKDAAVLEDSLTKAKGQMLRGRELIRAIIDGADPIKVLKLFKHPEGISEECIRLALGLGLCDYKGIDKQSFRIFLNHLNESQKQADFFRKAWHLVLKSSDAEMVQMFGEHVSERLVDESIKYAFRKSDLRLFSQLLAFCKEFSQEKLKETLDVQRKEKSFHMFIFCLLKSLGQYTAQLRQVCEKREKDIESLPMPNDEFLKKELLISIKLKPRKVCLFDRTIKCLNQKEFSELLILFGKTKKDQEWIKKPFSTLSEESMKEKVFSLPHEDWCIDLFQVAFSKFPYLQHEKALVEWFMVCLSQDSPSNQKVLEWVWGKMTEEKKKACRESVQEGQVIQQRLLALESRVANLGNGAGPA